MKKYFFSCVCGFFGVLFLPVLGMFDKMEVLFFLLPGLIGGISYGDMVCTICINIWWIEVF